MADCNLVYIFACLMFYIRPSAFLPNKGLGSHVQPHAIVCIHNCVLQRVQRKRVSVSLNTHAVQHGMAATILYLQLLLVGHEVKGNQRVIRMALSKSSDMLADWMSC